MSQRNIICTIECYIKKDGKYLMLHRAADKKILPNVWMAPGGKREHNEGVFAASRREILEETNLTIKNLKILCTGVGYLKDLNQEIFFHFVGADYAGGHLPENPADGELKWLTLEEILKLDNLLGELKGVLPIILGPNPEFISYTSLYEKGNDMVSFQIEKGD